jgi:molybdenum cofactor cytidylyltransferase
MGKPKMVELLDGKPLAAHAAEAAMRSRAEAVLVVTGCAGDELHRALDDDAFRFVDNADWSSGLASSIRKGLEGVEACGTFDALLILLGDQPTVTAEILDALIERFEAGESMVACAYDDGAIGPPVLFGRHHFPALRALEGDQGARALLRERAVPTVSFATGHLDVDTPEELEQARQRTRSGS